jgi:hypothetical protein
MARNFEKRVLQKCLRITFYTYKPVNPFHFLKKHQNNCTLLGNEQWQLLCSSYIKGLQVTGYSLNNTYKMSEGKTGSRILITDRPGAIMATTLFL